MISQRHLEKAARILRDGGLVAFPTETVYGLGANALSEVAVKKIYEAKGRPATSPLIVHVSSLEMARELAWEWPDTAENLAQRFWPGPLTLVVYKRPLIPDLVTAGLPTVGLRMPASPIALELVRLAGVPIAAPSANRFSELSATRAEHVRASLGASVDCILEGGTCQVGIESTVLSLAGGQPVLLRPGMVSREQIEAVIGAVGLAGEIEGAHPSPGLHARHYSPQTPVVLVAGGPLPESGNGAWIWIGREVRASREVRLPADAAGYAAQLYDTLHQLDQLKLDWIAVELPPDTPEWQGVVDRLRRAAAR